MQSKKPDPALKQRFAAFCLQLLQANFRNRKFRLDDTEEGMYIRVEGAYTFAQITSSQTMYIHIGDRSWMASRSNCVMKFDWAFKKETEIRKRQSHQRQQMKLRQNDLRNSEMLGDLDSNIVGFSGHHGVPSLVFTFPNAPDDIVARVEFNAYRIVKWHGAPVFTVYFGDMEYRFKEFAQVLSFFNGNEVFKRLDERVKPADLLYVTDEPTGLQRIIMHRSDIQKLAPHLIIMDAADFEFCNVSIVCKASTAHRQDEAVIEQLWSTSRRLDLYLACQVHRELQWGFDYAPSQPDKE